MRIIKFTILLFVTGCILVSAQENKTGKLKLTIDRIFLDKEFNPSGFGPSKWLDEGDMYTTLEESESFPGFNDIVRYETESGKRSVLVEASRLIPKGTENPLEIDEYEWSCDKTKLLIFTNTKKVWRVNTRGDYYILNLENRELTKIGKFADTSRLMFAKFSPDGKSVGYVYYNNIYTECIETGEVKQLTFDGSLTIINGTFDWVYEEELDQKDGFRWSPDSKSIAFWQLDASGIGVFNMINYTDSIYSKVIPVQYPKVGTPISSAKIGVVNISRSEITWMKIDGDPLNNYLARMNWADNSDELIIQQINRHQNTNRLLICKAVSGVVDKVLIENEDTWLEAVDDFKWLDEGKHFTWVSEKDGWRHVYIYTRDGKDSQLITPGNYDVIEILKIDDTNGYLYFIASPEDPARRYLYRTSLVNPGEPERLTPRMWTGTNEYDISDDGRFAVHHFHSFFTPDYYELITLPGHKTIRSLVDNSEIKHTVENIEHNTLEFFKLDVGEGVVMEGWCLKPADFDPDKMYPVLFHVYGEPAGQTVLDQWRTQDNLWHTMLSELGYVVISLDNRGTPAPKGREWRKCVYKKIGILASIDQANGLRTLIKNNNWIDENRIGIWGWSGGGSMTLNMLFRYPDLYKMGIAVAPVGNQKLYDNVYQERYMGLPWENEEGYREGSPVTYANQLEGKLLLIHGTGDDNVHYQNSELIINELIKNNKQFSMFAYPNRDHSIRKETNDRRHIYQMMTNYILENL